MGASLGRLTDRLSRAFNNSSLFLLEPEQQRQFEERHPYLAKPTLFSLDLCRKVIQTGLSLTAVGAALIPPLFVYDLCNIFNAANNVGLQAAFNNSPQFNAMSVFIASYVGGIFPSMMGLCGGLLVANLIKGAAAMDTANSSARTEGTAVEPDLGRHPNPA